ncbi:MAG: hypothetical protein ATN35_13540 [Epulopiscium sp. Nele67-Bin004]|nr:MAG: hypothetical protein ATN35_13540 [Epulopiscium sp. Nele67-Bin004]
MTDNLYTNKIQFTKINYEAINKNYFVIKATKVEPEKKFQIKIMRMLDNKRFDSIQSLVYNYDDNNTKVYLLFSRDTEVYAAKKLVQDLPNITLTVEEIDTLPLHVLGQLLFNTMKHSSNKIESDIERQLYYNNRGWDKEDKINCRITKLRIQLNSNCEIQLQTTTFTEITLLGYNQNRYDKIPDKIKAKVCYKVIDGTLTSIKTYNKLYFRTSCQWASVFKDIKYTV